MNEIDAYDYQLPEELIAQDPLPQRTDSRLLVVRRSDQTIHHSHIRDIAHWLKKNDCLVLNDTRVLPARLVGRRTKTGGKWTGLFLKAEQQGAWLVLGKTRGKLQPGELITLVDRVGRPVFGLRMMVKTEDGEWIARPDIDGDVEELLAQVGRVPLPPYIRKGEMRDSDLGRYQTVYANEAGAVAAPTAGLHFSESLLANLQQQGVSMAHLTLHVGLGTFRPVTADRLDEHDMHTEQGELTQSTVDTIGKARSQGGRVIAVGTTAMRVLETAALSGKLAHWRGDTNLFIRPGHTFRAVDALLTNFHLPRSTLLILVRTFGGDELMQRAYETAITEQYRFYSYGDAMLIL